MTIGEEMVRLQHYPLSEQQHAQIKEIKTVAAKLIDLSHALMEKDPRAASMAKTYTQLACWAAVNAITKKEENNA